MPSPVILARKNIAFTRPDWNNLRIDPQAPEAQNLYVSASVPLNRSLIGALPYSDASPYRWPVTYTAALGTLPDDTVGSYAKANSTATRYVVTLTNPPPSTSQATMAVWVRRRGALVGGSQFCSLAANIGLVISTDATNPALLIWGNAPFTTATGLILPLDEWSLVVGTHQNAFSTIYLFSDGINASFGPYADSNVTRRIATLVAGSITNPNMAADYAELAFWARAFSPGEVQALWDPQTRWRRYYVPKTYWQLGDTPVADTQPLAAQGPRPRYLGLNAFSPQAQGLRDWLPAVDGALVQATTSNTGTTQFGFTSDVPSVAVQRVTTADAGGPPLTSPTIQPSDLGFVARSAKEAASQSSRTVQYYTPLLSLAGMTDVTFVYWIYPLPSAYTDAWYWGTDPDNDNTIMQNNLLTFQETQSFALSSDPHIPGRWQMITVARTLAGVTIWRDQDIVFTGASTGTALAEGSVPLLFQVGGVELATTEVNGVNALWADFRIYNREWKQPDVDYAYDPQTRWDYYADTALKPWQLPLTPTPPVVTFLSRLALMGAG